MPCEGKITVLSQTTTEIVFIGTCNPGTCTAPGGCTAKLTLSSDGKTNKHAKIGSSTGNDGKSSQATICVTASGGDEDNGVVQLACYCGEGDKNPNVTMLAFTVEESLLEDLVKAGIPALIRLFK